MVGTSSYQDIFCKSCGGRKSIFSLVFCDNCAERRNLGSAYTGELAKRRKEEIKRASQWLYNSELRNQRRAEEVRKEINEMKGIMNRNIEKKKESDSNVKFDDKKGTKSMNIKKKWISKWINEQDKQREDERKRKDMGDKQRKDMEDKQRKDMEDKQRKDMEDKQKEERKKMKLENRRLKKEREKEKEKDMERNWNEWVKREKDNKKRTERYLNRDRKKKETMTDDKSSFRFFFS